MRIDIHTVRPAELPTGDPLSSVVTPDLQTPYSGLMACPGVLEYRIIHNGRSIDHGFRHPDRRNSYLQRPRSKRRLALPKLSMP